MPAFPRAVQGVEGRGPARLLGEAGDGHPEHARAPYGVEVELVRRDLEVRRLGLAVEVEREVVGREDLAERHRRREPGHRGDVAVVHAEALEGVVQELAERVGARPGDDGAAAAVAGGGDGHVGRASPEYLPNDSTWRRETPLWRG
jgi:hypothetical protein